MIIIKSIKGLKFKLRDKNATGYAHSTGLAFFDSETGEFIAGNDKNGSTEFPYVPMGGRKACNAILNDRGDFFELQPRVIPMEA